MADSYTKEFKVVESAVFERTSDLSVAVSVGERVYVFTPEEWREVERALQIAK